MAHIGEELGLGAIGNLGRYLRHRQLSGEGRQRTLGEDLSRHVDADAAATVVNSVVVIKGHAVAQAIYVLTGHPVD